MSHFDNQKSALIWLFPAIFFLLLPMLSPAQTCSGGLAGSNLQDCTGTPASPCHSCDVTDMDFEIRAPDDSTTTGWQNMSYSSQVGTCSTSCTEETWVRNYGYNFCPQEGAYDARTRAYTNSAWETSAWQTSVYSVNWDTSSNWCTCKTGSSANWFSSVSGGSNGKCCGDDGASDDFYYHSADPTTATSLSCTRCLNASKYGPSTLYGNGYWSGSSPATDTSGTCYYGDITCNANSGASGASGTYYGNGYVSGSTCYYGNITCSDGSASHGSSCTLNTGGQCIADVGCLNSPTSLSVTAATDKPLNSGLGKITLSWADNSTVEDGFKIERSTDGSSFSQIATAGANTTSYTDSGLEDNMVYYYRVRAYDGSYNSGYSNTASASTADRTGPNPPNLTATADNSNNEVDLSWDWSSDGFGGRGSGLYVNNSYIGNENIKFEYNNTYGRYYAGWNDTSSNANNDWWETYLSTDSGGCRLYITNASYNDRYETAWYCYDAYSAVPEQYPNTTYSIDLQTGDRIRLKKRINDTDNIQANVPTNCPNDYEGTCAEGLANNCDCSGDPTLYTGNIRYTGNEVDYIDSYVEIEKGSLFAKSWFELHCSGTGSGYLRYSLDPGLTTSDSIWVPGQYAGPWIDNSTHIYSASSLSQNFIADWDEVSAGSTSSIRIIFWDASSVSEMGDVQMRAWGRWLYLNYSCPSVGYTASITPLYIATVDIDSYDPTDSDTDNIPDQIETEVNRIVNNKYETVGLWHFNEGSGSSTIDASGNGNTGTISGATWTTNGVFGNALSFDGSDDWVSVSNSDSVNLHGSNEVSIEAWINPSSGGVTWYGIVSKGNGQQYAITLNSPNRYIHFETNQLDGGSCGAANTASGTIPLDEWSHVVAVYDGSTKKVYINGIERASVSCSYRFASNTEALRIGQGNNGEYFKGLIDEVRIYNRALTQSEIQSRAKYGLYRSPTSSGTYEPVSGLWDDFEDGDDSGWTHGDGTWSVGSAGGRTYVLEQTDTTSATRESIIGQSSWTDYVVETEIYAPSAGDSTNHPGIVFRATDTGNYHVCYFRPHSSGTGSAVACRKTVNGSLQSETSGTATIPWDKWFRAKIVVTGTTAKVYINGVYSVTYTVDTASGKAGLFEHDSVGYFDNFKVTILNSSNSFSDSSASDQSAPNTPAAPSVSAASTSQLNVSWSSVSDNGDDWYFYAKAFDDAGNESSKTVNPGLDADVDGDDKPDGWNYYEQEDIDCTLSTDSYSGPYAVKCTRVHDDDSDPNNNNEWGGLRATTVYPNWDLEVGKTYVLEFDYKGSTVTSDSLDVYFCYSVGWCSQGLGWPTLSLDSIPNSSITSEWQHYSDTFTYTSEMASSCTGEDAGGYDDGVDTCMKQMKIGWGYYSSSAGTEWFSVDNVKIHEVASATVTTGLKDYFVDETTANSGGSDFGWGSGTGYSDSGLVCNTQYCYKVKARDNALNESSYGSQACKYTLVNTPTAPSVTAASPTQLDVSWNSVCANNSPEYYADETTANSGASDFGWSTALNYSDSGLACNTQYSYRVKARNEDNAETGYSSTTSSYTLTTVPSSVSVNADSSTQLTVSWSECANNSPENWIEETSGNPGGSDSTSWQTANSFVDSGLNANTQYCYKVKARNANSIETTYSSQVCKYTLPEDPVPVSSSHTVNECSNDNTIDFTCSGAASSYYYVWNQASDTTVSSSDTAWDGSALTKTASSDGSWYLHVIAVNPDGAYNSSGTVHLGPFPIDTQLPTTTDDANTQWQGSDQSITLSPSDGSGSGIADTYYCIDTGNTCSPSTSGTTVNVSCASGSVCQQYVRYYSVDVAGNTETVKSVLIRIDKEPPTTSSDANTEWVNADQTVNFTIIDGSGAGGDSAFYCIDETNSCTPTTLDSSATVTCAAGTVCQKYLRYKGVDYVGNEDQIRSVLIKIDKQSPTTSSDANTQWQSSNQTITLTPSDGSGSGIADTYYCVDESNTCSPGASGTTVIVSCASGSVCQNYVRYYSKDNAGNNESIQSQLIKIDKQLPSTSDDSNSVWQKTDVLVALSPSDGSGSGIANTYYCIDSDNTCSPSTSGTSVSVTCATGSICQRYVRYYSTDNAGNQESIKTSNLIKIDKQLPVTTDDAPTAWQSSNQTITLTPSDGSGSGIADTYYCYDDSNSCNPNISGTSITIQCPSGSVCQKYLRYYSIDVAGNNEGVNVALVRIDKEKPTTTDNAPSDWVNYDVNVALSPSDGSGSGIADTYYCIDDSNSCSPSSSGTIAAVTCDVNSICQKYVRYYSIDNVSNQESVNWALVKIDKNGPHTSHNVTEEWYGDDVNVELTCSSSTNSCIETTYRVNGGSWTVYSSPFTVSATGINTIDYNSRDSIGNVESIKTVYVRIDRTAPSTTNDANTFWQNTDMQFNLLPSDSQSGVAATYYCIDTTNSCNPTTPGTTVSVTCEANQNCNKYVRYYSVDNVNNAESPKSVLVRIDKRYPFTLAEAPSGCVNIDFNVALTCVDEGGSGRHIIKYRFDSEQWLSSPQLTQLEELSWWDLNWARRRKILFDNSGQSAKINASVLLRLNSGNFHFLEVQEDGRDLRFIDSDGHTQLQYFIDTFSRSQQDAVVWVKVPQIDADSSTDYVWMYYSNSNADANQVANWFG